MAKQCIRGKDFPIWKGKLSSHSTNLYNFSFQQLYWSIFVHSMKLGKLFAGDVVHTCADGERLKGIHGRREKWGLPQHEPWGNCCAREMFWCRLPPCSMAWGQDMQTKGTQLTGVCLGTQRKATGGAEIRVRPTSQLRNHTRFLPFSVPFLCVRVVRFFWFVYKSPHTYTWPNSCWCSKKWADWQNHQCQLPPIDESYNKSCHKRGKVLQKYTDLVSNAFADGVDVTLNNKNKQKIC